VQRCQEKKVPDIETDCEKTDGKTNEEDPAHEQAGDMALTEPTDVNDLTEQLKAFNVDTSAFGKGSAKTLQSLFNEMGYIGPLRRVPNSPVQKPSCHDATAEEHNIKNRQWLRRRLKRCVIRA